MQWNSAATILMCALLAGGGASAQVLIKDGKSIPLKPSTRYIALKLNAGVSPSDASFTAAVENRANGDVLKQSAVLQKHRIVVIRAKGAIQPTSPSGPHFTAAASAIGEPVPVYAWGDGDMVLTNEIIFKPLPAAKDNVLQKLAAAGEIKPANNYGAYVLQAKDAQAALELSNSLAQNKAQIVYSQPNLIFLVNRQPRVDAKPVKPGPQAASPNQPTSDLYVPKEWSVENRGAGTQKKGADAHLVAAWNASHGSNIVIAILDEGVDAKHEDLRDHIVATYDAVADKTDQTPNPWDGHGTACAGIAAAVTNNGVGIAGAGYDAKLLAVRIATKEQGSEEWNTDSQTIARGIDWAVDHGADILSNSWGGGAGDSVVEDAIRRGLQVGRQNRGAVFVFAAGNAGVGVEWPANLAGSMDIIAVGATNEWDEIKTKDSQDGENWWASNFGPEVTIMAPGVHIFTTDIAGAGGYASGDYFSGFNGTSSATPLVAGIAALLLAKEPQLTPKQVKDRIHDAGDAVSVPKHPGDPPSGVGGGRVNACKVLHLNNC